MTNENQKYENLKSVFCDVSRETFFKLELYEKSLAEWQEKMNLVSKNTLDFAWNRHFLDSVQIYDFIPKNAETLCDIGSGAGFPGMVLSVVAAEKTPYLKISLVESINKKTVYLNFVKEKLGLDVEVLNQRAETILKKFDVITSRAVASLDKLFGLAVGLCKKDTTLIFLKGEKYAEEIAEARRRWLFDCDQKDSKTSEKSKILIIKNLRRK